MRSLKHRIARFGLGFGLAATMALSAVVPALADDPGLTITGGALAATAGTVTYNIDGQGYSAGNAITLNGLAHTVAIKVPVTMTDFTGNDLGWNTTLSLSAFTDENDEGSEDDVLLGEPALAVTKASSAACDTSGGKVCSNANAAVTNHATATTYTTGTAAIKIFSSDDDTHLAGIGMGQYTYDTELGFTLPRTAKAGAYAATLTVTAVAAP